MSALALKLTKITKKPSRIATTRVREQLQCSFMVETVDVIRMAANVGVRQRAGEEVAQIA